MTVDHFLHVIIVTAAVWFCIGFLAAVIVAHLVWSSK